MPAKRDQGTERSLHKICAEYLNLIEAGDQKFIWFPVPNGTFSSPKHKHIMRTHGELRNGVHDIMIVHTGKLYGCELKTETGKVSKDQKDWHKRCLSADVPTFIIRSIDDMVNAVLNITRQNRVLIL